MSATYDHGPLDDYEVTWLNGAVDRFKAHQVTHTGLSIIDTGPPRAHRILFHGEFDGQWRLVFSALEDDIRTVRNLTRCEETP